MCYLTCVQFFFYLFFAIRDAEEVYRNPFPHLGRAYVAYSNLALSVA